MRSLSFWFSTAIFIYPILIFLISNFNKLKISRKKDFQPAISIIISAFNEEKVIEKTIRNFLKSDYDLSKIEFVIGSDNSTDSTNQILSDLKKEIPNLKFFAYPVRRGKSKVLNDLVKESSSDILIFADGNTIYHKDAIKSMVKILCRFLI
jgi:cellulose synthase/poly-beta-1,6-N-acetylglucosamine synthase-like glycosyltransferase